MKPYPKPISPDENPSYNKKSPWYSLDLKDYAVLLAKWEEDSKLFVDETMREEGYCFVRTVNQTIWRVAEWDLERKKFYLCGLVIGMSEDELGEIGDKITLPE